MYIVKIFTMCSNAITARHIVEDAYHGDRCEVVEVNLPEGKTFDDVQEWKMLAEGEIEYRMKGETDYRYFKP